MIGGHIPIRKTIPAASRRVPKNIQKAVAAIDQLYSDSLSLGYLDRESDISRYHFSRMFKHHIGCSFKTYLNQRRIEAAKNLMKIEDLNVSEACFSVGFNVFVLFFEGFQSHCGRTALYLPQKPKNLSRFTPKNQC